MQSKEGKTQIKEGVEDGNSIIFQRFKESLRFPQKFGNGDIIISVRLACYGSSGMFVYSGSVILLDHGGKAGRIGISGENPVNGGQGFAIMVEPGTAVYSAGRSSRVMTIEGCNSKITNFFHRIDIEEQFGDDIHDFILWSN